jgi:hypothetical protein
MIIHLFPIFGTLCYLSYPTEWRINTDTLYYISVFHNSLLILFSAWTFTSLSQIIYTEGVVFQTNYYFQNPYFDKIIYFFYLSKYYEYGDTFLLYLNGKKPIFLQKFHHIGAVICWHLCYYYKVDFVWMPSILNSFVHTIMYSYYLGCLLKNNYVRFIKQYITTLQLGQFLVLYSGIYFYRSPIFYRNTIETFFNYIIMHTFALYGIVLIILFGDFYYQSYMKKTIK